MNKYLVLILFVVLTTFIISGAVTATDKVSKNKNGVNSNSHSSFNSQSISADGRYIVFDSDATDMVDNDGNGASSDVFIHDRVTKKTKRVNFKKDGSQPEESCYNPVISSNGRYIAYSSWGDLGFNTEYYVDQIYFYDTVTQKTELISQNSKHQPGKDNSYCPSISADGRYVAFDSKANNLYDLNYEKNVDTNDVSDIFLRDRQTGITKRISISPSKFQANEGSEVPYISGNGRYVAFFSYASNLVAGTDNGGYQDIFVRDLWTETTRRIMAPGNTEPHGDSTNPCISANGQYVAFTSDASNLVANDYNGSPDIFLVNMFTSGKNAITLISQSSSEIHGNSYSIGPSISDDGRYVSFSSISSNLVSGDTNNEWDVFVRDCISGLTKRLSVSSTGAQDNENSIYNAPHSCISGNGKYIAFTSYASNLVPGDTDNSDVFINTVDFIGPMFKYIKPKNKTKKVKRSKNIIIYFNEKIRINKKSKIYIRKKHGYKIKVKISVNGNKLIINPKYRLKRYSTYYITLLKGAISDFANNYNYNRKLVFRFKTGRK